MAIPIYTVYGSTQILLAVVCCCFPRNELTFKHDIVHWVTEFHLSIYQVSCLSMLWLVRYVS